MPFPLLKFYCGFPVGLPGIVPYAGTGFLGLPTRCRHSPFQFRRMGVARAQHPLWIWYQRTRGRDGADEPLSSLLPPRPGSPARRPSKPLIDIGELVGGNTAPPVRTPEQSRDSQVVSKEDSPSMRPGKTSFGIEERLSALASGISGSQPSRLMSPESTPDEAFIPPRCSTIRLHNLERPLPHVLRRSRRRLRSSREGPSLHQGASQVSHWVQDRHDAFEVGHIFPTSSVVLGIERRPDSSHHTDAHS